MAHRAADEAERVIRVSDDERRRRIAARHRLHPEARVDSVPEIVNGLVALSSRTQCLQPGQSAVSHRRQSGTDPGERSVEPTGTHVESMAWNRQQVVERRDPIARQPFVRADGDLARNTAHRSGDRRNDDRAESIEDLVAGHDEYGPTLVECRRPPDLALANVHHGSASIIATAAASASAISASVVGSRS